MSTDPLQPAPADDEPSEPDDLFGKLDSLIQKHQGRTTRRAPDVVVPMLTEPVDDAPPALETDIPMLQDAVDIAAPQGDVPRGMIEKRRQLQVALYLRLRQRLDQELNAALADNLRLGAVAIDPAFTRVAQELRSVLPTVVRESVEQVFGLESLEALLGRPSGRDSRGR